VQDRTKVTTYYHGLIGSHIRAFDCYQNQSPWMTLNGRNITLAEMNKISGAHHKYFNEDRRWLHLTVYTVNIKGMSTRLLSHSSLCVLFITTIRLGWW